jgi:hypothetical protein
MMIPILGLLHAAALSAAAHAIAADPPGARKPERSALIEARADGFVIVDRFPENSGGATTMRPVTLGSTVILDAILSAGAPQSAKGGRP